MQETTICLKPREQWRPGMTMDKLIAELDQTVSLPGIANVWVPPIRNRLDMLATGIKSPVGIKVNGDNLHDIELVAGKISAKRWRAADAEKRKRPPVRLDLC
ncbi:Cobalt-zinc-cadmium resistance protein CzcA Cation efflux system protein CusA [Dickeya dianthicola RNS04.9]|nr:Cobalt-zinc-cadmium resistance protein CzcA Cation efflux system protein CusA [Dickeya dianthicola RNS04.9]